MSLENLGLNRLTKNRRSSNMGKGVMGRPIKPACTGRRAAPGERGFEVRTFECSTCDRTEQVSMSVDPMKRSQ
jgi:hypothetical protein